MARTRWRTVSCADDSRRTYTSEEKAYAFVAAQPAGDRFRVQVDEGRDWQPHKTVVSRGDGTTDEEAR
jgi:hypothetical protein